MLHAYLNIMWRFICAHILTLSSQLALCLRVNICLFMMSPFGRVGFLQHTSIGRVYLAQCLSTECVISFFLFRL